MWGKEGFSFGALLDIVNPLQHIPVVSTVYRAITGDTIGPAPRMMGGALFGGIVGLIASAADSAVEAITGKDTGSHVLAMLPEHDPVSQVAFQDDQRGHRARMVGLMNMPDTDTMLASAADTDNGDAPSTAENSQPAPLAALSAATPEQFASSVNAPAESPEIAPVAAPHRLNVPPRTAQLGAGGQQVPLTARGRAGVIPANLPTPQNLAADPALLREMRQGGTAALAKPTGRIDTAIKGRGIVAPNGETNDGAGAPNWLDYAVRDPRAMALEASDHEDNGANKPGAPRAGSAMPEVGPDFLMKMQQALDKYQAARIAPAPSVDLSH
jgi:hypothetical protein